MDLESKSCYGIVDLKNQPLPVSRFLFLPTPIDHRRNAAIPAHTLCAKYSSNREYLQEKLRDLSWSKYSARNGIHMDREKTVYLDYHELGLELERAYLDGCHICSIVWGFFRYSHKDLLLREEQTALLRQLSGLYMQLNTFALKVWFLDDIGNKLQIMYFHLMIRPSKGFKSPYRHPTGESELPAHPVPISNASEESFRVARSWIKKCNDSHGTCKKKCNNLFPRRLLDLRDVEPYSDDSTFRLVLTDNVPRSDIKYATLSYCWGTNINFKLNSETFKSLTLGMSVKVLSKILRDAMYAARNLGINWIWIDSMCIMQDSTSD